MKKALFLLFSCRLTLGSPTAPRPLIRAFLLWGGAPLVGLFFLFPPLPLAAASAALSEYERGNEYYHEGKYSEAAAAYRRALEDGLVHADVYYNLGNAEFRQGHLGRAMANYLRAERLAPRDPDIRFNLDFVREKITARLPDLPGGALTKAFDRVSGFLSANEWTLILCAAYWLLAAGGVLLIFSRSPRLRQAGRIIAAGAATAAFLALPFATARIKRDFFTPRVVIVAEKVIVRSGPGEKFGELVELREGMEAVVGKCESGWCRLSAEGGFVGWVPADSYERL